MATRAEGIPAEREERFFFLMACAIAAAIVAGFGGNVVTGRVTFAGQPWYAHLHAVVFFGWTALLVAQSGLVASGNVTVHRRLGWLALAWVPAMVVLGIALTINGARYRRVPTDLPVTLIMVINIVEILIFAAMVLSAIGLRRNTAAHRRLMIIASSQLTAQAFGRLVPIVIGLGPAIGPVVTVCVTAFSVVGALHDKWLLGRVHPVWWLGIALQPIMLGLGALIPATPPGNALLHIILDGSPGAARIPPLP